MSEITGRKVFIFTASAFAMIMGVNFLMAYKAITTFPGLEVKSSYVASQGFDAERAAQIALGLDLTYRYEPALGQIILRFSDAQGAPVRMENPNLLVGRSTVARDDFTPALRYVQGDFVADAVLDAGKWVLHVTAYAPDGTLFRQRLDFWVKG